MRRLIAVAVASGLALVLSGCMLEFGSLTTSGVCNSGSLCALDGSGLVVGTPVTGGVGMHLLIELSPLTVQGTVTMSDTTGTVQESVVMPPTPAPTPGTFSGQYTVTGGSGAYQGATGSGTWSLSQSGTPNAAGLVQIGTFEVPGIASAASAHKRTSKMRFTIKAAKVCTPAGKHHWLATQRPGCRNVSIAALLKLAR